MLPTISRRVRKRQSNCYTRAWETLIAHQPNRQLSVLAWQFSDPLSAERGSVIANIDARGNAAVRVGQV